MKQRKLKNGVLLKPCNAYGISKIANVHFLHHIFSFWYLIQNVRITKRKNYIFRTNNYQFYNEFNQFQFFASLLEHPRK